MVYISDLIGLKTKNPGNQDFLIWNGLILGCRDEKIINRIIDVDSEKSKDLPSLKQKEIATHLGITERKLSAWVNDSKKNHIDEEKLKTLYNALVESEKPRFRRLAPTVLDIRNEIYMSGLKANKAKVSAAMEANELIGLLDLASSATIILMPTSSITNNLPDIFKKGCTITQLNIVASIASYEKIKAEIEQWAYGIQGNYTDNFNLKVFAREQEPLAEMIGVFTQGKYSAFIYQDGYVSMSELGCELLLEQEQRLLEEQPIWQLARTAEARIITRLVRDYSEDFTQEVLTFLARKIDYYEDPAYQINQPEDGVRNELYQMCNGEIRTVLGDQIASDILNRLEYYQLLD